MPAKGSVVYSAIAPVRRATIGGFGAGGYHLALEAMPWITHIRRRRWPPAWTISRSTRARRDVLPNTRYLTGFTGSNGCARSDGAWRRSSPMAGTPSSRAGRFSNVDRVTFGSSYRGDVAAALCRAWIFETRVEGDDLTVAQHRMLLEAVGPGVAVVALEGVLEEARAVKDEDSARSRARGASRHRRGVRGRAGAVRRGGQRGTDSPASSTVRCGTRGLMLRRSP